MEKPSWAKIIGAFMIVFAGCGITQDVKQINSEALTSFSKDLAEEIATEFGDEELGEEEKFILMQLIKLDKTQNSTDTTFNAERVATTITNLTHMTPAVIQKMRLHGNIGLCLSILYAIAGFLLILRRKNVLNIVFGTLILSLLFVVYQFLDSRNLEVSALMSMGLDFNLYFGAFMDIILLIVLFLVDKSYFTEEESDIDYYDSIDAV